MASRITELASNANEKALQKKLSLFFKGLEKEVLGALEEYWSDTSLMQGQLDIILAPIHSGLKEYYQIILTHKVQEYTRSSRAAERIVKRTTLQKALKAAKPVKITATPNNLFGTLEQAEGRLANHTFTACESTMARVDQDIKGLLTQGYTDGVGIDEVTNRLRGRFDQLETWEAQRIARTEIHNAQNIGIMDTYQDMGVEYTQWMTVRDSTVRDTHAVLDGEIIPFGGVYSNGLKFPGDTDGEIKEWVNCRCANAPFVMPAGMMAPPGMAQFREDDLIKIETKVDNTPNQIGPTDITETSPTEAPTQPYNINGGERNSKVEITPEVLQTVLNHKELRANAKIEWGNLVDLKTGKLIHTKDIRGTRDGVKVPRPYTQNQFGLLHNHPAEAGFSGADMYNQLGYHKQGACFASTKEGLWIARDTELGAFMKKEGVYDSLRYETRSEMNSKMREISSNLLEGKYNDLILHAESEEQRNLLKSQYRKESLMEYNNWLLERFGVGKNSDNYFEIEFIPNQELQNVKF